MGEFWKFGFIIMNLNRLGFWPAMPGSFVLYLNCVAVVKPAFR